MELTLEELQEIYRHLPLGALRDRITLQISRLGARQRRMLHVWRLTVLEASIPAVKLVTRLGFGSRRVEILRRLRDGPIVLELTVKYNQLEDLRKIVQQSGVSTTEEVVAPQVSTNPGWCVA